MAEKYIHNGDNSTIYPDKPISSTYRPEIGRDLCRVKKYGWEYGGYRKDILTENLSEREKIGFVCTICEGIMKEACVSESGHQLCSCCQNMHYNKETPDVSVRKMINTLKCSCPLSERGCKWLGTLKDCEDHLDTCDYVYVSCKLTCGVVLIRNELEKHKKETCSQRVVKCDHCKNDFKSGEIHEHLNKCPKMKVPCDLCDTQITREDMPQHLKHDCGMVQETCQLGCGVKLTRNKLKIHENDTCVHRIITCKHCYSWMKLCDNSRHLKECTKVKVMCELCSEVKYRKDMAIHLKYYCLEKIIECPFVNYMCLASLKRKDMDNHLEEKETKHLGLKLTAMEDLISKQSDKITKQSKKIAKQSKGITKQNEEIEKQFRLLYSITETTKIILEIEDVTDLTKRSFESVIYTAAGYIFRFQFHQNSLIIVFPETASKYVKPFIAKCTIVVSTKQIKCDTVEVKQKDLTRGCVRNITSISQEDIDRYSQPSSPGSITKDLTLEIYLTMQ